MTRLATLSLCAFAIVMASAQTLDTDSIATDSIPLRQLQEVEVSASMQRLGAEVSTYIPTSRQKNAAMTAVDLLERMAIPQISVNPDGSVTDAPGRPVEIFIDYLPATKQDLQGMRTADVKRVEYYDYPADPHFLGKPRVINFIMQRYEYGGYVKPYLERCLGAGTGQWALFNRLQYKRLTIDVALDGYYLDQTKNGEDKAETFRLPQADGSILDIERFSSTGEGRMKRNYHYGSLRGQYTTDKLQITSSVTAILNRYPLNRRVGSVAYAPAVIEASGFESESSSRVGSIDYDGYLYVDFDGRNSLTFTPSYSYSSTQSRSLYAEDGAAGYYNEARDHTRDAMAFLTYAHTFPGGGSLNILARAFADWSRTEYLGTAEAVDKTSLTRLDTGAQYSQSFGKFYGLAGVGYDSDRSRYGDIADTRGGIWADLSLQYSPNSRHSAQLVFHRSVSNPSTNHLSANVIQRDPLMSYTGNPNLKAYRSYDASLSYTFIPSNRLRLSAYAYSWTVGNRYIVDYKPTESGILREIHQAPGVYTQLKYGVTCTAKLLSNKLQITASLSGLSWRNAAPTEQRETRLSGYLYAYYYIGDWTLGATLYSPREYPDGFSNSAIARHPLSCNLSAGWAKAGWNIRCAIYDVTQWSCKGARTVMRSPYYDYETQAYSQGERCFLKITAAYTFSFGKKVEKGDDTIQRRSGSSAILE